MTRPLFSFDQPVVDAKSYWDMIEHYSREYETAIYEEMRVNDLVETQATNWRLNGGGKYLALIIGGKTKGGCHV